MNWYSVFYWISVADNIKFVSGLLSIVLGIYFVIAAASALGLFDAESFSEWTNGSKRVFYIFTTFFFINFLLWAFIPSKKEAIIIVAGGAVGNFIMSDSSTRQIPAEAMQLLREKIRSEIKEVSLDNLKDTLQEKSKEELIELLKNKK